MGKFEKPVIIGIAGGSGSVKTTIAHEIADNIDDQDRIMIMTQDSYYKDNTGVSMEERMKINYDHPDAFDMPLLEAQLNQLMHRKPIEMPTYDFTAHPVVMKLFTSNQLISLFQKEFWYSLTKISAI